MAFSNHRKKFFHGRNYRGSPTSSYFEIWKFGEVENIFPLPATPIVHRAIKNLLLAPVAEHLDVHPLFDYITLPQLKTFTYSARSSSDHKIPTGQIISALNRFQCHVTDLTITNIYYEGFLMDKNLIDLLSNLSTVTRLSLQVNEKFSWGSVTNTDHLLRRLSRPRAGELETPYAPFLPLLKVLKLRRRSFSWADFREYILRGRF